MLAKASCKRLVGLAFPVPSWSLLLTVTLAKVWLSLLSSASTTDLSLRSQLYRTAGISMKYLLVD